MVRDKVSQLPLAPGVYLFKDAAGTVLYVGKAKSLRKRVSSYFSRQLDAKTQALVAKIADVEYRPTATESQAQLLEAALVKDLQPQYNIDLKDDKSFPWIRITREKFPVVSVVRRKKGGEEKPAEYFGPYTDARAVRGALKALRRVFPFCTCSPMPKKACLYHKLGLCPAPCEGKIAPQAYAENIERIKLFLGSKYNELITRLSSRMRKAAEGKRFEEAAQLRDQIRSLGVITRGPGESEFVNEAQALQAMVSGPAPCERIEAFDISNISGKEATGSMVSFFKGMPDKDNYRRFRIKTVDKVDDYGMMREVVRRRYSRLLREGKPLPDLVLIDGGKGHLEAALSVLNELRVSLPLMSIAKEEENLYIAGRPRPIRLKEGSPVLNLVRRVRDEAHRFAVAYHHILHRKETLGR